MATRDISSTVSSNIEDDVVYPFFAIELLFDSGPLRLWTGVGEATIDGDTYVGTGNLLSVSSIEETTELAVKGATITLSGVPSEVIALALQSPYQGRVCNIYFGMVEGNTYNNLTQIFSGYMDEMNIEETPETSSIELKVENKLIDLERARTRRYTSAYQKSVYPGDLGLDFVEDLQDKKVVWGRGGDSGGGGGLTRILGR
jgi:hypothetical protein